MGDIVILDELTANKIAAGEVVERPASVVKEMVENSIDAGATNITVEIADGGITKIKITDNGSGIAVDDVEMAFERHATSKIRSAKDLDSIRTLGFRGEALASISSVSKVELVTRKRENESGTRVVVCGGKLLETSTIGCPVGTTFIVSDLFYNTPARYKFLKKDTTEANYIADIINRMALERENIAFKYINKGKVMLHTPGNGDLRSVIFSVYGKDVASSVLEVESSYNGVLVSGFVGKPTIARGTRSWQSIYLNHRYIKSKLVAKAVEEAYATHLMKGKYPFYVLKIDVDTALVDVNVHPTKMEVRFSNEQDIFKCVYRAVSSVLMNKGEYRDAVVPDKVIKNSISPKYVQSTFVQNSFAKTSMNVDPDEKKIDDIINATIQKNRLEVLNSDFVKRSNDSLNESDCDKNSDNESINDGGIDDRYAGGVSVEHRNISDGYRYGMAACDENTKRCSGVQEIGDVVCDVLNDSVSVGDEVVVKNREGCVDKQSEVEEHEEYQSDVSLVDCVILGQLFRTYILLQKDNEFYMIDQHAAHERVMFERLRSRYMSNESMTQHLLTPIIVEMQVSEIRSVLANKDKIERLGFEVDEFGNGTLIIRGVPAFSDEDNIKQYFLDVVDKLIFKDRTEIDIDETLYNIACKSAIKAHKKMDDKEIVELLKQLDKLENPFTCPHGRPTAIKMTKSDVEKMFKRIV